MNSAVVTCLLQIGITEEKKWAVQPELVMTKNDVAGRPMAGGSLCELVFWVYLVTCWTSLLNVGAIGFPWPPSCWEACHFGHNGVVATHHVFDGGRDTMAFA